MVSDETVVTEAVNAAESVIFSRLDRSTVTDVDIAIQFEDDELEIDIYLNADDVSDLDRIADEAALAARETVDRLLDQD